MREKIRGILDDPHARWFAPVHYTISAVTLVSVAVVILETVPALDALQRTVLVIEYVAVGFFTLEYLARLFSAERPLRYAVSFFGIVDLVSILPLYLFPAGVGAFHAKEHIVRMARFLRMLRLLKIVRHRAMRLHGKMRGASAKGGHPHTHLITIEVYVLAVLTSILLLASALYAFEGNTPGFTSIPRCILWIGETIFGGSISIFFPMSTGGRIVAILTRFTGLVLFGLLVTVVARLVNRWLFGVEEVVGK